MYNKKSLLLRSSLRSKSGCVFSAVENFLVQCKVWYLWHYHLALWSMVVVASSNKHEIGFTTSIIEYYTIGKPDNWIIKLKWSFT